MCCDEKVCSSPLLLLVPLLKGPSMRAEVRASRGPLGDSGASNMAAKEEFWFCTAQVST